MILANNGIQTVLRVHLVYDRNHVVHFEELGKQVDVFESIQLPNSGFQGLIYLWVIVGHGVQFAVCRTQFKQFVFAFVPPEFNEMVQFALIVAGLGLIDVVDDSYSLHAIFF